MFKISFYWNLKKKIIVRVKTLEKLMISECYTMYECMHFIYKIIMHIYLR